jgi:cytoskeletal protein CcmA (bactofilin family)
LFLRKKRYSDVEGDDRISRIIDDGQSDAEEGKAELSGDDTMLLSRDSGESPAPRDTASTAGHEVLPAADPSWEESMTVMLEPAPVAAMPSTTYPTPFESPRMALPDLAPSAGQGGSVTLVAKGAVWEGKLVCSSNVRIEGTLRGEIETDGTLYVASEAVVDGTVRARNVMLAGEIKGDVHCRERLEILPGGAARGDIITAALIVHEGAFIDSRFQMQHEAATR